MRILTEKETRQQMTLARAIVEREWGQNDCWTPIMAAVFTRLCAQLDDAAKYLGRSDV